jgi:hypothetical protein
MRNDRVFVTAAQGKDIVRAAGIVEAHLRKGQDERALFDVPVDNEELHQAMWTLVNYAEGRV